MQDSHVYISPVAQSIPFDNDSNGFASDNVQDAIEEARTAVASTILPFVFCDDGTTYNKEWLSYQCHGISSKDTWAIMPWDGQLIGIAFSNKNCGVDIDIQVFSSSQGDGLAKNKIYEWQLRNVRYAYKTNLTPVPVERGDKIGIYIKDRGTNPCDSVVVLYFRFTIALTEGSENVCNSYGGGTSTT